MYKITLDNGGEKTIIHDGKSDDITLRIKNGQIAEEINTIPTLTFAIYPNNPGYDKLEGMYTKIMAKDINKSSEIFSGRVLTIANSMDAQGKICKTVTCKGDMDYLCDSVQLHHKYVSGSLSTDVLDSLIDTHNDFVDSDKQFARGQCQLMGLPEAIEIENVTTLEAIKTLMVDTFGGEITVRNENGVHYIDFADRFGKISSTEIKLAVNMKSITQTKDPTSVVTRLIPLGGKMSNGNRLTIAPAAVSSGKNYIDNTELVNKYGIICGTVIYEDIVGEGATISAAATELYNKAKSYMENANKELKQYQITALDLSKINGDFEEFELGNRHAVKNRLMGINEELRIIKRTLNLDEPHKSALTFGDKFETLTGFTAKQSKQTAQMIKKSSQDIRNSMQSTVDYITGGNGGYVVQKFNTAGQPIATWYTDNLDASQAKEMLIINNRGILGSTDGGKTYNTAIDIRGNINASMITAGILQGIAIICNNATITGGKINITTGADDFSAITLQYQKWKSEQSPTKIKLYNAETGSGLLATATGVYLGQVKDVGTGSIDTGTPAHIRLDPSGIIYVDDIYYKAKNSDSYISMRNMIDAAMNN